MVRRAGNRKGTRFRGVLVFAMMAIVCGNVACATSSDTEQSEEEQPRQVVGQPPSSESEDYQFAMPPPGPTDEALERPETTESSQGVISAEELDYLHTLGPAVVFRHVETAPHHSDGEFVGFEIVGISETARAYTASELDEGDVVTHVNLVRLETPDDYMEAWGTLEEAREIRIDFLREGQPEHLVWPVE